MKKITIITAVILQAVLYSCANCWAQKEKSILVGVEYFNGWWEKSPNKWEYQGKDWRAEYPDRMPLLGTYNSQATMDKDINAAAAYGVDFFSILWYYPGNVKDGIEPCDILNQGVTHFMESPNAGKMKFMIELCNHEPFALLTDEDWDKFMDVCIKAMKHPSYLRIDDRAVLKIHGGEQFHKDNGSSIERSAKILQYIRKRAADAGIGDVLITAGTYRDKPIDNKSIFAQIGEFDGTMQYMDVPELPQKATDYPYTALLDWASKIRNVRKNDVLPWVPYFPAGWNPKPWHDPRASFSFPTKSEWETGLVALKKDLLASKTLGFPKKDGSVQKAFTIYAWNEFGEGGILAPTKGDKYMKLKILKKIFSK